MIKKIFLIYNYVFKFILTRLNNNSLTFLIPLSILLFIVFKGISEQINIFMLKEKYKVRSEKNNIFNTVKDKITGINKVDVVIKFTAKRISMFNDYSLTTNKEISFYILFVTSIFLIGLSILQILNQKLWYITFFYLITIFAFIFLAVFLALTYIKQVTLQALPITFKLLNSRFISTEDILNAIKISENDFPKSIKRDMKKIYAVLNTNDNKEIEDTFEAIEDLYNSEYMTVLLLLIKQAYFKGNAEQVKEQFEEVTEDILNEIENQKDLSVASRMYMIASIVFVPTLIKYTEIFTMKGVGGEAIEFYNSSLAFGMKILIGFLTIIYIGWLLYLEKSI